eukprot:INCI10177.1.p1 GENE.INCI10177.1~~INCI10177.1.p1  ORF type:complete len:811 (+),score=147.00 INCI10177.1:235-2667(+)
MATSTTSSSSCCSFASSSTSTAPSSSTPTTTPTATTTITDDVSSTITIDPGRSSTDSTGGLIPNVAACHSASRLTPRPEVGVEDLAPQKRAKYHQQREQQPDIFHDSSETSGSLFQQSLDDTPLDQMCASIGMSGRDSSSSGSIRQPMRYRFLSEEEELLLGDVDLDGLFFQRVPGPTDHTHSPQQVRHNLQLSDSLSSASIGTSSKSGTKFVARPESERPETFAAASGALGDKQTKSQLLVHTDAADSCSAVVATADLSLTSNKPAVRKLSIHLNDAHVAKCPRHAGNDVPPQSQSHLSAMQNAGSTPSAIEVSAAIEPAHLDDLDKLQAENTLLETLLQLPLREVLPMALARKVVLNNLPARSARKSHQGPGESGGTKPDETVAADGVAAAASKKAASEIQMLLWDHVLQPVEPSKLAENGNSAILEAAKTAVNDCNGHPATPQCSHTPPQKLPPKIAPVAKIASGAPTSRVSQWSATPPLTRRTCRWRQPTAKESPIRSFDRKTQRCKILCSTTTTPHTQRANGVTGTATVTISPRAAIGFAPAPNATAKPHQTALLQRQPAPLAVIAPLNLKAKFEQAHFETQNISTPPPSGRPPLSSQDSEGSEEGFDSTSSQATAIEASNRLAIDADSIHFSGNVLCDSAAKPQQRHAARQIQNVGSGTSSPAPSTGPPRKKRGIKSPDQDAKVVPATPLEGAASILLKDASLPAAGQQVGQRPETEVFPAGRTVHSAAPVFAYQTKNGCAENLSENCDLSPRHQPCAAQTLPAPENNGEPATSGNNWRRFLFDDAPSPPRLPRMTSAPSRLDD